MRKKRSFIVLWISMGILILLINGCLVIPVNYHAGGSRKNIDMHAADSIGVGKTTRREVLLSLGEPEYRSNDGSHIGYAWTKVRALLIWGGYYAAGVEEITNNHVLEIRFDEAGVVTSVEFTSKWFDPVEIGVEPTAPAG